ACHRRRRNKWWVCRRNPHAAKHVRKRRWGSAPARTVRRAPPARIRTDRTALERLECAPSLEERRTTLVFWRLDDTIKARVPADVRSRRGSVGDHSPHSGALLGPRKPRCRALCRKAERLFRIRSGASKEGWRELRRYSD